MAAIVAEGRSAFAARVPLSGNPYATTDTFPSEQRLRDLAWSQGWLKEKSAAEIRLLELHLLLMQQATELARSTLRDRQR